MVSAQDTSNGTNTTTRANGTDTTDGIANGSSPASKPPATPDYTVRSWSALDAAADTAPAGATVYIPGKATLTATDPITFDQPGITVVSDGGRFGRGGATIRYPDRSAGGTTGYKNGILTFTGEGSTLRGVHLVGPYPEGDQGSGESGSERPKSAGVSFNAPNSAIYNSEVTGWTLAGIRVYETTGTHIYLNSIHDNYSPGLGYGVSLARSSALIEYNFFNGNRHGISSGRSTESSYTARGNVVGGDRPNAAFDVHGADDSSSSGHGGRRFVIVNNTFLPPAGNSDGPAANPIGFRGALGPVEGSTIAGNVFIGVSASEAMTQSREGRPPEEIANAADPSAFRNIQWGGNAIVDTARQAPAGMGAPASMPSPSQIPTATGTGVGSGSFLPSPEDLVQPILAIVGTLAVGAAGIVGGGIAVLLLIMLTYWFGRAVGRVIL